MVLGTVRAGPRGDAETGSQNAACLAASCALDTAKIPTNQEKTASVGPSAEAIAECDEAILDEIFHAFELIQSYAISGLEAARRGDRNEIRLRLRCQLRDVFKHAVAVHDLLSREPSQGSGL
jgi:hypothetical protein